MPKKYWTPELITEVGQLYREYRKLSKVTEVFNERHNTNFSVTAIGHAVSKGKVSIRIKWTDELLDDLQQIHLTTGRYVETAKLFNEKYGTSITHIAVEYQLVSKRKGSRVQYHYTDEQIEFLKSSIKYPLPEATKLFNEKFGTSLTKKQVGDARYFLGVRRLSNDEVRESKKNGMWFVSIPKSHPYYDKLFKYRNDKYKKVKGHFRIYVRRNIYNWITEGNELPENHVLMRINGNTEDDSVSNLRVATSSEAISVHASFRDIGGVKNAPPDLVDANLAMVQLNRLKGVNFGKL